MKTSFYFLTICLLVMGITASAKMKNGQVLSGNSFTELGEYSITKSEMPMKFDEKELETYQLTYENASNPVQIGIVKEENYLTFLVRSPEVEVQYICVKGVFGAKKMEKKYKVLSDEISDAKLDKTKFYTQRVIGQNIKNEKEMLGLIASYFPVLVEKQYHALL